MSTVTPSHFFPQGVTVGHGLYQLYTKFPVTTMSRFSVHRDQMVRPTPRLLASYL